MIIQKRLLENTIKRIFLAFTWLCLKEQVFKNQFLLTNQVYYFQVFFQKRVRIF